MSELATRLAKLSPGQRELLEARLKRQKAAPQADLIPKVSSTEPRVFSFAQERLWFLEQMEGPSATYNICSAFLLRGPLRTDALHQALTEIVRRHEVLRSTFPYSNPASPQIAEMSAFWRDPVEVAWATESEKEGRIREFVDGLARERLALPIGPLFQVQLLRLGADEHVLVILMHHIIADAWSFEVLFGELSTLYTDFLAGRDSSLPPLAIQYTDFASWQRQRLQGEELERHVQYWKGRLRGASELLELPTDFPRPDQQSYRGGLEVHHPDASLAAALRRLSRETDATLFMTLLAAFATLLHRYSGQADVEVGSPVTSRSKVEFEPLIGFFVNMMVLRTDFSEDLSARALIQRVRQNVMEDLSHDELPFEKLVTELKPRRSMGHAPFFQAALMFQEEGRSTLNLSGLTSEVLPVNSGAAKYDLSLYATEGPHGLRFALEYATDLFTSQTAKGLLRGFQQVLEGFAARPDRSVSKLDLLSPSERADILVARNLTSVEYPRDQTLHALFEEQARRTPDRVAVECAGRAVTYSELDRQATLLALELQQRGVGKGALVGLFVERSAEMVTGVLGVLKAGAAYVPLDPLFPKDRIAFMVADAQLSALVTQERLVPALPANEAQIVLVDAMNRPGDVASLLPLGSAEELAYVIYTSGSTGRPKGVQIPHRAVVNFLQSMRREPGLHAEDVLLAVTTLSFDIAGLELLLPLTTGAKVVVVPREVASDGSQLVRLLADSRTTVMQATPATWRLLLAAGWKGNTRLKILCGGEPLPPELARELLPRCGELWNMYGPTETTIWSTCSRIVSEEDIHIGRPIANTEIYILDSQLQPVPDGWVGELFIGGDGLARGYLNRPELTSEKFIPSPFQSDARLYRTGDLARYQLDGNLVCLGRVDFQVKVRGYRIELGEIESQLTRHPDVRQAVASVDSGAPGGDRLVAHVVGHDGVTCVVDDLKRHLRSQLPEYMVPVAFVQLDRLPLTPNGKVDRKMLPSPTSDHVTSSSGQVAPRNPVESKLAEILAELLGLERVGVSDDFFDLGGHSLLALKFFDEIERHMGRRLPLATLFSSPTVEQLARQFDVVQEWSSLVPIQRQGTRPSLFCVHGAGGNVLLYRDLAARLGGDYPVYGFQSKGLDGRSAPVTTIEDMAAHYLKELKTWQPQGPYCLAGYCLGGMVAYQMARQLRESGDEVALVALLDTYNPAKSGSASRIGQLLQRGRFHLANLTGLSGRDLKGYLLEKIRVARDGEFTNIIGAGGLDRGDGRSDDAHLQRINDRAVEVFDPRSYDGSVVLFNPQVNYDFLPDPRMGWGDLVKGTLDVVVLPVNPHAMLVEPFVKHLANGLRQRLDEIATTWKVAVAAFFAASIYW